MDTKQALAKLCRGLYQLLAQSKPHEPLRSIGGHESCPPSICVSKAGDLHIYLRWYGAPPSLTHQYLSSSLYFSVYLISHTRAFQFSPGTQQSFPVAGSILCLLQSIRKDDFSQSPLLSTPTLLITVEARCSPAQQAALFSVVLVTQTLSKSFATTQLHFWNPQSVTYNRKQPHQSPSQVVLVEAMTRLHLARWFFYLTVLHTPSVLCHTVAQVSRPCFDAHVPGHNRLTLPTCDILVSFSAHPLKSYLDRNSLREPLLMLQISPALSSNIPCRLSFLLLDDIHCSL